MERAVKLHSGLGLDHVISCLLLVSCRVLIVVTTRTTQKIIWGLEVPWFVCVDTWLNLVSYKVLLVLVTLTDDPVLLGPATHNHLAPNLSKVEAHDGFTLGLLVVVNITKA